MTAFTDRTEILCPTELQLWQPRGALWAFSFGCPHRCVSELHWAPIRDASNLAFDLPQLHAISPRLLPRVLMSLGMAAPAAVLLSFIDLALEVQGLSLGGDITWGAGWLPGMCLCVCVCVHACMCV